MTMRSPVRFHVACALISNGLVILLISGTASIDEPA